MSRSFRVVLAAALAVAVGLTLALYLFNRRGDDWKTLKDNASGITLSHPHDWAVQRFDPYCRRNGPGLLVSNVRAHSFRNTEIPNGCTNMWNVGGLPDTFVLADVSLFASPFPRHGKERDTELPLELDRFARPDPRFPRPDLIPPGISYAYTRVVRGPLEYSVRVWTGSALAPSDEKAVARLIRSIRISDPQPARS